MDRRPIHRDLLGVLAIWVFSLPALILSVLLTVVKFRSDHHCDESVLSACHGGWFSCATIFHDPWATVWGLPLTIYATAFYLVVAALAGLTALHPGWLRPVTRAALLVFGWAGLLVTALLAAYAVLVLGTVCPYCAYFYGTNLAVFLAVRMMHPGGLVDGLRPLLRPSETAAVFAVAVLGLVTAVMTQRAVYLRAVGDVDPYALQPCVIRLGGLEPSDIAIPSAGPPRFVVELFLDLDCPHCREDLGVWRALVADANEAGKPIELRVYQFPRDECDVTGTKLDSNGSCNAARALLCLTDGLDDPAAAMQRLERLFAVQDEEAPHFTRTRLAAIAREYGHDADPARPVEADPFFTCMQSLKTTATLHRHGRLARDLAGLVAPPGALLVPLADGRPGGTASRILGRKPRATLEAWIDSIVRQTERPLP